MKILFIAPRYTGGIGGHAAMLSKKLREHGFDINLMHVPHIPMKNLKNPSYAIFSALKGLFGNQNYDIVHAFNLPSAFAMRVVKARKKVLSVHGVYSEQVKASHSDTISKMASLSESQVLKWADKLTTDSKITQSEYRSKLGLRFEHMPSPIDPFMFKDIPNIKKIEGQVAYIGRDSFEKGSDVLRKIESRIKGKIVYCTNLPWKKAMTILKASSVLVVPSRIESLPTVIKEAFYLRVPVVATNVGGIPELVTHDSTGILVPPNEPQKLADAINSLLKDKDYATKLADAAYEYLMKNMTWDVFLPKYVEFYEKLIST